MRALIHTAIAGLVWLASLCIAVMVIGIAQLTQSPSPLWALLVLGGDLFLAAGVVVTFAALETWSRRH